MKRTAATALILLFSTSAAYAQEDASAIKARADAQAAQIAVMKAQLDLAGSVRSSLPNNASAIATGEKSAEAQILKLVTYRAAAAKLVNAIGGSGWANGKGPTPLVIMGSTPPSFALLNAYRSDVEAVRAALKAAATQWSIADGMPAVPPGRVGISLAPLGGAAVLGIVTNGLSMLASSTSVAGASLTADDAQLATIVEAAIVHAGGKEDFTAFMLARNSDTITNGLLATLQTNHDAAKTAYDSGYLRQANAKSGNDAKDAAIKTAGASLATALAAYDALHAKLLSDANGVQTAVAVQRLIDLEGSPYPTRPLLYILDDEASLSIETRKGPSRWFDPYPFELRAVVTLNYVHITNDDISGGRRGTISCMISATDYRALRALDADSIREPALCGNGDVAPRAHGRADRRRRGKVNAANPMPARDSL